MKGEKTARYGWVIVGAAFAVTYITCGINFSYGVLFLPIVNEFGWSRGLASAVMLWAGLTYALTLPLTGILADRYGYKWVLAVASACLSLGLVLSSTVMELWQLYMYTGLLVGLSISASFAIPVALVSLWFTRRQGLAVGTATLGISLGTATIPVLISYLISTIGWRPALLYAGIIVAVTCLPATLLMRNPPRDTAPGPAHGTTDARQGPVSDLATGLTLAEAVRTPQFWMIFTTFLLFLSSLGLIMLHMVPYAADSGIPPMQSALLITLIGLFGIGGRLSSGVISDRIGIKPVMVFCAVILGLDIAWISFSSAPWSFYLFASVYGLSYSGFVTQMVRIARQTFGGKSLGSIFAALMVSDGLGFGLGPWIAGLIFDSTGSYHLSFLAAAIGMALATVLAIMVKPAAR